ncbi:MAG: PLDc N-terminal domain-containing protein [Bacteroidota bacterium]
MEGFIGLIVGIIAVSLAIWAIIDVIRSSMNMNQRTLWIVIVIIFPIVGPLIYFLKGKASTST